MGAKDTMRRKSYWADSEGDTVLEKIAQSKKTLETLFEQWVEDKSIEHPDDTVAQVEKAIRDLVDVENELILEANFYKDK